MEKATIVNHKSEKQWIIALLLSLFIGSFGLHRLYLGHKKTGIVMLILTVTSPFLLFVPLIITAIWAFVDFVLIAIGRLKDANGKELSKK